MMKTPLATAGVIALFALSSGASAQSHAGASSTRDSGSYNTSSAYGSASSSYASPLGDKSNAVGGGVGVNARARLSDQAAPDHNVKLVFSLSTGNYLADVDVKVTDRSGKTVIDGVSPGPWLYAKLPAGTYTAKATYMGETVTEDFTVGRSGQRVAHLRWPAKVEMQASAAEMDPILGTGPQEMQR
jgi:hypothetical protein